MGRFRPGLILGTCADLAGSWCERPVVHVSQLHAVPEGVPGKAAALAEPLAIGLHAVLLAPPIPGQPVAIVGGGPIAFAVLLAIRMLGLAVDVTLLTQLEYQRQLALELGADRALVTGPAADEELARIGGLVYHRGLVGRGFPTGGFPRVYDCVGAAATVRQGLELTGEKGTFVLIGNAGRVPGLDLTLVWTKEITVQGTLGYGLDRWEGERRHTFEWLMRFLPGHAAHAARMVTHVFPFDRYPAAVHAALDRSGAASVKVLFGEDRAR